jgi:hypothetical protein
MLQSILDLSSTNLVLAVAVGILILYLILPVLFDPLRDIPGPFLARFTRYAYCPTRLLLPRKKAEKLGDISAFRVGFRTALEENLEMAPRLCLSILNNSLLGC